MRFVFGANFGWKWWAQLTVNKDHCKINEVKRPRGWRDMQIYMLFPMESTHS